MHELALFGLLALAVSQAAWIVADSNLFDPVRRFVLRSVWYENRPALRGLDEWINCSSCVGMWLALAAALLVRPDFLLGGVWVSVPTYALGLALVARGIHAGIELLKRVAVDEEDAW